MPDISMCANEECPKRNECYRFTATPSPYRQSYAVFNVPNDSDRCDNFWPNSTNVTMNPE